MSSRWISTSFRSGLRVQLRPQACAHVGVRRLDQRRLAHAARAPQQRVVGGQAAAKRRVLSSSCSAARSMPLSSASGCRLTWATGWKRFGLGLPDEGLGRARNRAWHGSRRRQPVERGGKALQALQRTASSFIIGLELRAPQALFACSGRAAGFYSARQAAKSPCLCWMSRTRLAVANGAEHYSRGISSRADAAALRSRRLGPLLPDIRKGTEACSSLRPMPRAGGGSDPFIAAAGPDLLMFVIFYFLLMRPAAAARQGAPRDGRPSAPRRHRRHFGRHHRQGDKGRDDRRDRGRDRRQHARARIKATVTEVRAKGEPVKESA